MNYKNFKHVWCVLLCLSAFASSSARFDFRSGVNAFRGWLGWTRGLASAGVARITRFKDRRKMEAYDDVQNSIFWGLSLEPAEHKVCGNLLDEIRQEEEKKQDQEGEEKQDNEDPPPFYKKDDDPPAYEDLHDDEPHFEDLKIPYWCYSKALEEVQTAYQTLKGKLPCEHCDSCTHGAVGGRGKHSSKCRAGGDVGRFSALVSTFVQRMQNVAPSVVPDSSHHNYLQQVRDNRRNRQRLAVRNEVRCLMTKRQGDHLAESAIDREAKCKEWRAAKALHRSKMADDRKLQACYRKFTHLDRYRKRNENINLVNYNYHMYGLREPIEAVEGRLFEKITGREGRIINDDDREITPGQLEEWFAIKKAENR